MATPSVARSFAAREQHGYVDKGIALARDKGELFTYLGEGRWLAPSATVEGHRYEVTLRGSRDRGLLLSDVLNIVAPFLRACQVIQLLS